MTYKVKKEVLKEICDHLNKLLSIGVTPGTCMEIIRGHATDTQVLEIYDTGDYNFQVKIVNKK